MPDEVCGRILVAAANLGDVVVDVGETAQTWTLPPGAFHVLTSMAPAVTPEAGLVTVAVEAGAELPGALVLEQNYPNPFNPVTTIRYALPEAGPVRLEVVDLLGRRVALLVDEVRAAGQHAFTFDARTLPSGTYLYRLQSAGRTEIRRMTLVK